MDTSLFTALIQSLHSVEVRSFPEGEKPPLELSEKYAYHPKLQACFLKEALEKTVEELPKEVFWEIQDSIGVHMMLFHLEGRVWIVGPFVPRGFQEKRITSILISAGIPASYLPSLKLFYSAFPLIQDQDLIHSLKALIRVLQPQSPDFSFRYHSSGEVKAEDASGTAYRPRFDYKSIEKRYELENRFLRCIEEGDTAHVLETFDSMGISEMNKRRYISAVYDVPEISLAIVRAISRKAAERGGAPLTEINEITQRFVQATTGSTSEDVLMRELHEMILKLTEAVHRSRDEGKNLSQPVKKVVNYLRYNFSQSISLDELAEYVGFAPSYLSRVFKAETGMTISVYLREMRCREAAQLLKESDSLISEIGAFVGYPDNNYFTKAFRKVYGVTPGAYRTGEH